MTFLKQLATDIHYAVDWADHGDETFNAGVLSGACHVVACKIVQELFPDMGVGGGLGTHEVEGCIGESVGETTKLLRELVLETA